MIHLGNVPASTTIYVPFATYAGSTGASVTCTGLAVTDVEIYKNGSVTQRSSDAGIALLDTDGIDFDGITGLHGFSIDLSDNTDASFYAVGSWYWVVVSAITVDSQTVTFLAATFRIAPAEGITGYPKTDIHALKGDATSATDLQDFADAGYDPVTNKVQGVVLVDTTTTNTDMRGTDAAATAANLAVVAGYIDTEVAAIKAKTDNLPTDPADQSAIEAAITAATSPLATAANLATVAGYLDTEIAAILADTNELQTDWANGGRLDLILDARSSQTSVDDIPTNAELTAALASADDAVLAAITALNNLSASAAFTAVLTTQLTESYAADGVAPTLAQAIFLIQQALTEFAITVNTGSGTSTTTIKKLDGSTSAATLTLNSETIPTSATRAT